MKGANKHAPLKRYDKKIRAEKGFIIHDYETHVADSIKKRHGVEYVEVLRPKRVERANEAKILEEEVHKFERELVYAEKPLTGRGKWKGRKARTFGEVEEKLLNQLEEEIREIDGDQHWRGQSIRKNKPRNNPRNNNVDMENDPAAIQRLEKLDSEITNADQNIINREGIIGILEKK